MPEITFKQFARMLNNLPERLNDHANVAMIQAGAKSVKEVKKQIRAASTIDGAYPLVDRREMILSTTNRIKTFKGRHKRTVTEVVVDVDHAQVMEFGAAPFTPPLAPLIEWARRKKASLRASRISGKGRGAKIRSQQLGSRGKGKMRGSKVRLSKSGDREAKRMAYLVQQKMRKRGIRPRFYMGKSMPKIGANVQRELRRSMKQLGKKFPIRVTVRKLR